MNLNWIEAANLMSIGNSPIKVEFGDYPKTLIVGKNGAGKSLLVEMISFLWFGKSYRKLTKSEMVNSINKKALLVSGEWTANGHTWKVIRGIKPDRLEVFKDGKEVDSAAAKRDFQKYIEEAALTFNYDSFKRIIALGTAGYKPFMDMSAQERRSFVEEILDIQIFSVMSKLNKDEIKQMKSDLSALQSEASVLEHKISTNREVLKNAKDASDGHAKSILDEIQQLDGRMADLVVQELDEQTVLENLEAEFDKSAVDRVRQAIAKINQLNGQHQGTIRSVDTRLKFFETTAVCPTCDQSIADSYKESIESQLIESKTESEQFIQTLNERLQQANERMLSLDTARDAINAQRAKLGEIRASITSLQSQITSLRNQHVQITTRQSSDMTDVVNKTKELISELKSVKSSIESTVEQIRDRELLTLVLKDDGVKSRIVESYLPIINGKVNEYLRIMDANYGFTLDQNFKETMKSRGRESLSFNNLSQGQRMRVDLALMFTWRDVVKLRSGSYTNVLLMDEIMDSAADEDGIVALRKIIDKLEDTNTIIISHSDKHNKAWFSRILKVSNSGMFTKYEETINPTDETGNIYE